MEIAKKEYLSQYYTKHRVELLEKKKKYYEKNKEKWKKYAIENKEKIKERRRIYYQEHKEEQSKIQKEYDKRTGGRRHKKQYINNRKKCLEQCHQYNIKIKEKVITHYGGGSPACVLCGHKTMTSLSIDHINGRGFEHRKDTGTGRSFYSWLIKNNYPDGYRTLCMNCQWDERAKNGHIAGYLRKKS